MHHLLAYNASLGVAAANADVAMVADQEFTARNNHLLTQDDFRLLAAAYLAASATGARISAPTLNGFARHHIWPIHRSATIPDDPRLQDMRMNPLRLPAGEEIAVEASNDLGAATERSTAFLWLAGPSWSTTIPTGIQRLTVRATYSITTTAYSWSALGALTFAENLRGGRYTIVGLNVFDANSLAVRLVFGRGNMVNGRRMRPGVLCQNAVSDRPNPVFMGGLGVYGEFLTIEPPQVEVYATNTAAHAGECRVDLIYSGGQ